MGARLGITEVTTVEISLGAFAFWIALASVLIASGWFRTRREQIKQETLLRLVERTGQLDEAQVKLLFPPPPAMGPWQPAWHHEADPQEGKKVLRGFGTVVMFIAAGLAVFATIFLNFGTVAQQQAAIPLFATASLVAFVGLGLLAASKFATGQPDETSKG
jgi:hypothetical protein